MDICHVVLPAGNRFHTVFLMQSCAERQASGTATRSAWRLQTSTFRSLLVGAPQSGAALMFCSNQTSSVTFRRLHSVLYPPPLWVYTKTTWTKWNAPLRESTLAPSLVCMFATRSWPCEAIVMRGSRIFHLSLAAWLAANGLCLAWFNPLGLRSAITYEMTTVSHPVSHLPWFHTSQRPNHSWEINERRLRCAGRFSNYTRTYGTVVRGIDRLCACV